MGASTATAPEVPPRAEPVSLGLALALPAPPPNSMASEPPPCAGPVVAPGGVLGVGAGPANLGRHVRGRQEARVVRLDERGVRRLAGGLDDLSVGQLPPLHRRDWIAV